MSNMANMSSYKKMQCLLFDSSQFSFGNSLFSKPPYIYIYIVCVFMCVYLKGQAWEFAERLSQQIYQSGKQDHHSAQCIFNHSKLWTRVGVQASRINGMFSHWIYLWINNTLEMQLVVMNYNWSIKMQWRCCIQKCNSQDMWFSVTQTDWSGAEGGMESKLLHTEPTCRKL